MSLSADPSVTLGSTGNAKASSSLAASGTVSFVVDFSANVLGGFVQIWDTTTAVAATNGLTVQAFATADGTNFDTVAFGGVNFTMSPAASSTARQSFFLPTGKYTITLTNLDATNAVTIAATSAPVS
jgi:hypothetical protein